LKKISIFTILIICLASPTLSADKIILTNGEIVEGEIINQDVSSVTMRFEDKSVVKFSRQRIKSIEIEEPELFKKAKLKEEEKDFKDAVKLYKKVVKSYSGYSWAEKAQYGLAVCYLALEKDDDALKAFQSLLADYPQTEFSLEAKLNICEILVKQKKYQQAIKSFENILETEREGAIAARVQYRIGDCCLASEKTEDALLAYLKVTLLYYDQPEWAEKALLKSGGCYESLGDEKNAKECYLDLIKEYPGSSLMRQAQKKYDNLK